MAVVWDTDYPENDDVLCVVEYLGDVICPRDHYFAWWHEGCGAWDCPDRGWFEKEKVVKWSAIGEAL